MTKNFSVLASKTRLLKKIRQEKAFLSSINSGWTRVQRREPGQLQWTDYTATEAQRSAETIAALKDILAAMETGDRPPEPATRASDVGPISWRRAAGPRQGAE